MSKLLRVTLNPTLNRLIFDFYIVLHLMKCPKQFLRNHGLTQLNIRLKILQEISSMFYDSIVEKECIFVIGVLS